MTPPRLYLTICSYGALARPPRRRVPRHGGGRPRVGGEMDG